jgi:hypothetical protein
MRLSLKAYDALDKDGAVGIADGIADRQFRELGDVTESGMADTVGLDPLCAAGKVTARCISMSCRVAGSAFHGFI